MEKRLPDHPVDVDRDVGQHRSNQDERHQRSQRRAQRQPEPAPDDGEAPARDADREDVGGERQPRLSLASFSLGELGGELCAPDGVWGHLVGGRRQEAAHAVGRLYELLVARPALHADARGDPAAERVEMGQVGTLRHELGEQVGVETPAGSDEQLHREEILPQEVERSRRVNEDVEADDGEDHHEHVDHRPLAQRVEPREGRPAVVGPHDIRRRKPQEQHREQLDVRPRAREDDDDVCEKNGT
eukprot:scaffold2951_cov99-Isochrysis_galbana.AAC.3